MIYGFVHIYQVYNWTKILDEQLYRMERSGLLDKIDKLFIGAVGRENIKSYCNEKIELLYQIDKPELYEALTLSFLRVISCSFIGHVFYIHTKGISRNSPQGQTDWRRLMEYYVLDRHNVCLKELKNNDIVGTNWHLGNGYMGASPKHAEGIEVTPHFSGNFWWANTEYIKRLPNLYPLRSRFQCEFWIGKECPRVAELWNSGIHHHGQPYPPEKYINRLNTCYFRGKKPKCNC